MEQETLFDLGPDWAGFDKDIRAALNEEQKRQLKKARQKL